MVFWIISSFVVTVPDVYIAITLPFGCWVDQVAGTVQNDFFLFQPCSHSNNVNFSENTSYQNPYF